ncbi:MAG: hypothetical protein AAF710_00350 [Planctomycetota bacterium]
MNKAIPLEYVDHRIASIGKRLESLADEASKLETERSMLHELRKGAVVLGAESTAAGGLNGSRDGGTTGMIADYVAKNPGIRTGKLIDALENEIESSANDKRRVISASIANLTRGGRVRKDEEGCLWPNVVEPN